MLEAGSAAYMGLHCWWVEPHPGPSRPATQQSSGEAGGPGAEKAGFSCADDKNKLSGVSRLQALL